MHPNRPYSWLLFVAWTLATGGPAAPGASQPTLPQTGPHFFVIVNLDSPEPFGNSATLLRGITETTGIAHETVILAPNTPYREWILQPGTMDVGTADFTTPSAGNRFTIPSFLLEPSTSPDSDGDGVHDLGEFIVGTNAGNPDTDGDGVTDGAELRNGTNALDGRPAAVGIVAAQDTAGNAVDVAASHGVAAIADSTAGVILFDVSNALNPVRSAQVDTPGSAIAVAFGPGVLAVADGSAGLAIVDVTDPPAAGILHQLSFGAAASAIATDGATGYVGLDDGSVAAVDLPSGALLQRKKISTAKIQDVAIGHEALYALVAGTLHTIDLRDGELGAVASVGSPGGVGAGQRRLRVSPAGERLFATFTSGVNVFSLANPQAPALVRTNSTAQAGWKQIVPNGSGLAVAAVDANSTDDGVHDISLYALPGDGTLDFRTTIQTPGLATAVALYNGLAFVADGQSGLQVANYLAYDSGSQAPTIALSASFPLDPADAAQAEEGKRARVTATVTDDVQVRNVEFLIDGEVVLDDGGFPFELRFLTPVRSATRSSFTLQARAFDTGGNVTASPVYSVTLVPDATPPRVKLINPENNRVVGRIDTVLVTFSEPLDLNTVTPSAIVVRSLGADRVDGTADDAILAPALLSWRDTSNTAVLGFAAALPPAIYRVTVDTSITDLAGNHLEASSVVQFIVFGRDDRDRDGVPDDLESVLGLDPDNPDTDGDGVIDGDEDFDNDGLTNSAEVLVDSDPTNADTDGDTIKDGDEDPDADSLADKRELVVGTDPRNPDTDGDGWNDETEITAGSDPLQALSRPRLYFAGVPRVVVARPLTPGSLGSGGEGATYIARPAIMLARPQTPDLADTSIDGTTMARPHVVLVRPETPDLTSELDDGTHLARPPVNVDTTSP